MKILIALLLLLVPATAGAWFESEDEKEARISFEGWESRMYAVKPGDNFIEPGTFGTVRVSSGRTFIMGLGKVVSADTRYHEPRKIIAATSTTAEMKDLFKERFYVYSVDEQSQMHFLGEKE